MRRIAAICMAILLAVLTGCARQQSFSYALEEMAGTWTQKYDGSGTIEISESGGRFAILIRKDTEDGSAEIWSMTAVPADGTTLRYKDCISLYTLSPDLNDAVSGRALHASRSSPSGIFSIIIQCRLLSHIYLRFRKS